MFNLIKAWFKRPVVINFNVETIPDDAKVCVLTTTHNPTKELIKQIESQLLSFTGLKSVVLGGDGQSLQTLNDEDLKAIGLIRISKLVVEYPDVSELDLSNTYLLPAGERVINTEVSLKLKQYLEERS